MEIGELVSALSRYCGVVDDGDYLLFCKSIYSIEITDDDYIKIYFCDANTNNVMINRNGEFVDYLN